MLASGEFSFGQLMLAFGEFSFGQLILVLSLRDVHRHAYGISAMCSSCEDPVSAICSRRQRICVIVVS